MPKVLRSNIVPPTINLGKQTLYFLPEILLVKQGARFGAVSYDELQIRSQTSRFIEDRAPPADAQVVDRTWKHPNKNGGPDRRFRDNRQLPVCLYDVMHLSSNSGLNELTEFSRTGFVQPFSMALHDLPRKQSPESVRGLIGIDKPTTPKNIDGIAPEAPPHRLLDWKLLVGLAAVVVGAVAWGAYALRDDGRTPTAIHASAVGVSSAPIADPHQDRRSLAGAVGQPPSNTSALPTLPSLPIVTVKTPANIRSGPTTSATFDPQVLVDGPRLASHVTRQRPRRRLDPQLDNVLPKPSRKSNT